MTVKEFIPSPYTKSVASGNTRYKSPSNIALVKYWGKKENQIPANPSISFTLNECATVTTLSYRKADRPNDAFSFEISLDGKKEEGFKPKIKTFFERVYPYLPFLKEYHFEIETSNSFPHSSGIASSASGMSALALCLMEIERNLDPAMSAEFFNRKASFLARLGSGSAARSIKGSLVQWGEHAGTEGSSDLYGIEYPYKVHSVFNDYCDTILLVDKGQKQVSSTVGHDLMHDHPFSKQRFDQAHANLSKLRSIFEGGDLDGFIGLVESEALTLHAMMMTSRPYFILMKPNTLEIINRIWAYREATKTHVCFTLDAGANVHVLYPKNEKAVVEGFIADELAGYCQNGQFIHDHVGRGAQKIN
ncbi:diphosphomevalonate/mevalonate 3,5-bisphosphate decarboxylase family protein [Zobellia galactanivorans]|uniref:diphosphomevalonate/mevalonate 3,5-bisphosphate decarboxylase family protein n=1 Tax=Zobellia galactanivorans (strain DSM 12802 / CCUG 47099 / CIP 106680 / NCIMB 13871 / Dsij) TaxID=63186 RepID=UPI001C06D00B|nr:diphosphomevalonate decarboxylase [Zobellia galactanivorans]MBU3028221.1 diphosphomevalonate decarboxylase [Zobellia galactanivorans]